VANLIELLHGPDGVRALGALLRAQGETLSAQSRDLLTKIEAIEAGAPWGTDDTGVKIAQMYSKPGQYYDTNFKTNTPANEALKGWLLTNGPLIEQVGQELIAAMGDLSGAEIENLLSMLQLPGAGG
jgi:hypothetical protein